MTNAVKQAPLEGEVLGADPTNHVREVQQARASSSKLATLVGKAGQWIIEKVIWRPHVMDGTTAGGHPLAFQSELLTEGPTLQQTEINNALTSLGVYAALEELITEYGGTVPTSLSETNAVSAQSASDPWADLN